MDDSVCPLCCEELDISDQQFFPCKCGYQVCMWCWHRIRETESGLCPACRTPYGDDPHEFSAVDVQEVLKANKEKEAAAKREREKEKQQHQNGVELATVPASLMYSGGKPINPDGTGEQSTGIMDIPKDRSLLANMRVIRRNLVYCVGLPPSISTEEQLRKPDYFGQYGRIAKIVINRSQISNGDPRRASCSAYVTFVHKEDTLACILSVDGFYLENRTIRASYGTSKYCSAFIKHVRCSNPECTYLHEMGAVEDTFTKQEIQAGYVTSGRDVLARQQQIVEQALASAQGGPGSVPRRRIGGGGPSGTGKAATNPVFPVPEFDEPQKAPSVLIPAPKGMARANSTGAGMPAATAAAPQATAKPLHRAASVGGIFKASVPATASRTEAAAPPVSAASVVAGVYSVSGGVNAPSHAGTTLTPLTPLKRASKPSNKSAAPALDALSMPNFPKPQKASSRNPSAKIKQNAHAARAVSAVGPPSSPPSPGGIPNSGSNSSGGLASLNLGVEQQTRSSLSSLGGDVIAAPRLNVPMGAIGSGFDGPSGSGALNGMDRCVSPAGLSGLGGEVFTGPLPSSNGHRSAIGSNSDKWGGNQPIGPPGGLWGGSGGLSNPSGGGGGMPGMAIGGGIIGSGGGFGAPGSSSNNNGTSALASLLGINLPTGIGSLHESSNLWSGCGSQLSQQAPVSSLHGAPMPMPSQGVIGRSHGSSGMIGGVPIGGNSIGCGGGSGGRGGVNQQGAIGSSNKNDIALLQSLLPEVHITSGNGVSSNGGWNPDNGQQQQHQQPIGVGAVGRNISQQAQPQGAAGSMNIW